MARIPRAQELGLQSGPAQQTRGVVDVPVPDTSGEKAAGRAMVEAGSKLYEFGAKIQQAQVDRDVVAASRKTREDLDRAYRDLEQAGDLDPTQFEKLYRETSDKIIAENAKAVPGGGRAMWEERARNWQSDGVIQSRNLTRTRQLEAARANLINENAAVGKQVGDLSLSEATVEANILGQRGLIDRQVREGFLGKDDGARLIAELDTYLQKDKLFRARDSVERLTMAGDDAGAETLIAEFKGTAEEQKALSQAKEAAQQDLRAETNRQEAERRKLEIKASNEFEMGILTEGYGYKQLQSAVDRGEISINDQPALYRSIRAEQDRKKAEAAASKLSAEEKARLADRSADWKQGFEAFSFMDPASFMAGRDAWDPKRQQKYDEMTPDDQRAVDKMRLDMTINGQLASNTKTVFSTLVDEAKRIVPEWQIGSTAKDAPREASEFPAKLYEVAQAMNEGQGGKPLTNDQVRDAVARALDAYQPGKWDQMPANMMDRINDTAKASTAQGYDYRVESMIFDAYREQFGRAPKPEELKAEYARITGGQQ